MGVEKQDGKVIIHRYKCGACNKGYMVANNPKEIRASDSKLAHTCDFCKRQQFLDKSYPYVGFEPLIIIKPNSTYDPWS